MSDFNQIYAGAREWITSNLSRAYPFADDTGGHPDALPCRAIVDAFILTEGLDPYSIFISAIRNTGRSVMLTIQAQDVDGNTVVFGDALTITFDCILGSTVAFSAADADSGAAITGSVTVGYVSEFAKYPAYRELPQAATKLFYGVVKAVDQLFVTGIVVGDKLLVGAVTIEAGDGIDVSVDTATNSIKITATQYTPPEANMTIIDDASMLSAAVATFGNPVRSVGGVFPDQTGTITIVPKDSSDLISDYVAAEPGEAPGVLRLKLQRDPCLELATVQTLTDNIVQLDQRGAMLDRAIVAIDQAIGSTATQLTRL